MSEKRLIFLISLKPNSEKLFQNEKMISATLDFEGKLHCKLVKPDSQRDEKMCKIFPPTTLFHRNFVKVFNMKK